MCGVAGIANAHGRPVDRSVLAAMTGAMRHRGPDDSGLALFGGGSGPSAGLGHRRLSVIDLSELGRQPMANEDGTVHVAFNGEIYNFRELRAELESRGHRFRSASDTETIVHGYEEWGDELPRMLDGMFALAVWDDARGRMLLARDRFGKKPLYWWNADGELAFASELGALLKHPDTPRTVEPWNLSLFLQYEYVPAPHTILAGVGKLGAGEMLVWLDGDVSVSTYWALPEAGADVGITEEEACEELESLFSRAVKRRLVSDVPLGLFLSGGIDSSAIASFMADHIPAADIRTFSIGFKEASFDESGHARTVAEALGTRHSERLLTEQTMLDVLPGVLDSMSEPLADPSIIPTSLLSSFTREHVTVALGGDGGDELFAGYDPFLAQAPSRWAARIPRPVRRAMEGLLNLVPASERNMSLEFRAKRFLMGLDHPADVRQQVWLGAFDASERSRVLIPEMTAALNGYDPLDEVRSAMGRVSARDDVDRMIRFYLRFYMAGDILAKVDTASMAHSLEVRSPFLDTELAEFVCGLPSRMKLRGLTRKYLLRRMLRGRLPHHILARSKKGFGIPLGRWLKGGLRELAEDLLSPSALRAEGLFDPDGTAELLNAHLAGRRDNRKQLWTIMCFRAWHERYLG